ncbi:hypothetical protein FQA39_LY02948 [Lamprigera yunnana]|nr:hypothetical protein FQA39_LY02948 [Lamprigera yunnana]
MKFIVALSLLLAVATAVPRRLVVPVKDAQVGKSRIISGSPAKPGQYAFQVINESEMMVGNLFCGGALISSHWVLTSAHCASGASSHTITMGTISSNGDDPKAVVVHTTSHIVHENYDSWFLWNDVALVDLVSDVKFKASNGVSPVLNFVNLTTISNEDCDAIIATSILDSTLCCKGNPEHGTCRGDSGGPLFEYDSEKKPRHIGVVSFVSAAGCASGYPSGYGRTSSHIS